MTVSYGKGEKAKATRLHSQVVRARGRCERCGSTQNLQAAHIIRRRFSNTRTDERAAWCLCASCHFRVDTHADEFMELVEATIGRSAYFDLKERALSSQKVDWGAEVERLLAIKKGGVVTTKVGTDFFPEYATHVCEFILRHTQEWGWPPTIREIAHALDIPSTSTMKSYLDRLVLDGKIVKGPGPRMLKVVAF